MVGFRPLQTAGDEIVGKVVVVCHVIALTSDALQTAGQNPPRNPNHDRKEVLKNPAPLRSRLCLTTDVI